VTDLRAPAETAIHQCLALRPGERCVVVTDDERLAIGEAIYDVASEETEESVLARYRPGDQHGEEPPEPVAAAMAGSDVVLAPTTKSVTHTRVRSRANEAGARIATLPGITEDVFVTGLDADYDAIEAHCEALHEEVADAEEIQVTSPQGTDVAFGPGDREWRLDTGIVHEPGAMSNLPAGEVFVSPETADGTVVIDGTMMPHGRLEAPITVHVADGYVTDIEDEGLRGEVEAATEAVGRDAYNVAELGIGTNVAVTELVGSVLLDEKAAGTVHVAIGDDHAIGGDTDAPIHLDGILTDPSVFVDGEELSLPSGE
jgi:leucyl aminopeptidase (aminopeptidase T)